MAFSAVYARRSDLLLQLRICHCLRHLFVVGSLDKQMQNEKELIRLASAGVGGGLFYIFVESINFWLLGGWNRRAPSFSLQLHNECFFLQDTYKTGR